MKRAILALCASALLACAGSTDSAGPEPIPPPPPPPAPVGPVPVVLNFCLQPDRFTGELGVPTFFAYRNDGEAWITVSPDANGNFAFSAAPKLAFTFVRGNETETFYTTASELTAANGLTCKHQGGKTLNGSLTNLGTDAYAVVTAGSSRATGAGAFTLTSVPDGPIDLLAINYRDAIGPTEAIIRRDLSPATGSTIPAFDFSTAERVPLSSNLLTVTGLLAGDFNYIFITIRTANGTTQVWENGFAYEGATRTFRSIPSALVKEGDVHTLNFMARGDQFASYRIVNLYYRQPSEKSVVLGPKASPATFTIVATTPYLRMRGTIPSQPEYAGAVRLYLSQSTSTGGERGWIVTGTARHFGGSAPSTWDVEMPDLSAVPGFPASAGFEAGQRIVAGGEVRSELFDLLIGRSTRDGDILKMAGSPITIFPGR